MKKLIFVDNDNAFRASEDIDQVKNNLEYIGKLPESYIDTISTVCDFSHMDKDEAYKMMFDKNNVVCTWSMFTATHYGSLNQLFRFLKTAGAYGIKGVIHIDCSGKMKKALNRDIADIKNGAIDILKAIETNYLITISDDWSRMERIRVNLSSDDIIISEEIDLVSLINDTL